MDWLWILLIGLFAAPMIGGLFHTSVDVNAFVSLGDITGMPIDRIIATVGQPTSVSASVGGTLYQWQKITGSSGYHYAILVDGEGKAITYTHQFVQ